MDHRPPDLHITKAAAARVTKLGEAGWHLEIPEGARGQYRLAELDDHGTGRRTRLPWKAPLTISLQARVSGEDLPGTWGFGLWNDPFSFLIGYEGVMPRLPALPEAAWFFYASQPNYLSFRDDLPANCFLAATFNSSRLPSLLLMALAPFLAISVMPGAAQLVRRFLRRLVRQDAAQIAVHTTDWHTYRLEWEASQVRFYLDELLLLRTAIAPRPPLSLVLWVDNQYAALPPRGGLGYGYLRNPEPAWLEIRDLLVQADD